MRAPLPDELHVGIELADAHLDRIRRDLGIDVHVLPAAAEATTVAEMAMRLLPSRLEQGAASQLLPPPAQCACYDADALAECLLRLAST